MTPTKSDLYKQGKKRLDEINLLQAMKIKSQDIAPALMNGGNEGM